VSDRSVSLKGRVLKSGGWVIGGFFLSQVIRFGSNLLLTRLLIPEAFGLVSIIYVLMSAMALFTDIGINQNIIQNRRGSETVFLNTAWLVQISRGIFIWSLVILLAYLLPWAVKTGLVADGSTYADPLLPRLLFVFSFDLLISGFTSTKMALAQRKVQLKEITQIELFSQVVALVVMFVWAFYYPSVWALVGGAFTSSILRLLLGHFWLPGPLNRLQWDAECFKEIFHFGKWIFLLSILGFLWLNGDRLIFANLLGPTQLGIYSIAYILSSTVINVFSAIMTRVLFPAMSEVIQKRPENLPSVYQRLQTIADLGLFGVAGFLYIAGEGIIDVLYDSRYHDAGYMLSILSLGLIGSRYAVVEYLCMAKGHMKYLLASNLIRVIALYLGMLLGYKSYGMEGALFGIVFSFYVAWPISLVYKYQHGLVSWWRELLVSFIFPVGGVIGWVFLQGLNFLGLSS